jgi:hypothetical protein
VVVTAVVIGSTGCGAGVVVVVVAHAAVRTAATSNGSSEKRMRYLPVGRVSKQTATEYSGRPNGPSPFCV